MDDEFIRTMLERARKRQAKLEEREEVSYPPLSPLPEEEDDDNYSPDLSIELTQANETYQTEQSPEEGYSAQPSPNESEYQVRHSPESEVYRAEPVVCHISPDAKLEAKQELRYDLKPEPKQNSKNEAKLFHEPQPIANSVHESTSHRSRTLSLEDLHRKVERAQQTKEQLKKAVEVSKHGSKEHVEAARLLQITDLEHLAFTNHLAMLEKGIKKKYDSSGSLKLSGIKLKISAKLRNDLAEDCVAHYFFCVACCGTDVKATELLNTNDIRRQDLKAYLQFKEPLMFADLPPEFVLKLDVFELVFSQNFPKLLSRLTPSKKSRPTLDTNFKRVGSLRLSLADRDVTHKNLTQWSKHEESKYIERECKFQLELRPEQLPTRCGMLHVRHLDDSNRPDWSRYWVDLSSAQIKFWRTKQDALECKKPNQTIGLRDLCCESVQKLTPDDDLYRQNSFVIYSLQQVVGGEINTMFQHILKDDRTAKIVKHQLAADDKEDRDKWCALLDKSMNCFREWNGKARIFTAQEAKELFASSR